MGRIVLCALLAACFSAGRLPIRAESPPLQAESNTTVFDSKHAVDQWQQSRGKGQPAQVGGWDMPPASPPVQPGKYTMVPVGKILGTGDYPTVKLGGFFQADAGFVHQSASNRAAVGDVQDGADFRRARLKGYGNVAENVGYIVEFDFGFPGRPSFMDVWLEVQHVFGDANIRVGQYRQPIGMMGLTGATNLPFLERALPFALLPFRQIGVMFHGTAADKNATWAVSGFRFPTGPFGGNVGDNGGFGIAARVSALLIGGDDEQEPLLHAGAAFSFADPASDAVGFLSQPEFFVSETGSAPLVPVGVPTTIPPFVATGVIPANNVSLFGGELGARFAALTLQGEVLVAVVDTLGGGTAVFPGAYVHATYLLTGEVKPYDKSNGVFGAVTPNEPFSRNSGLGAWEIAARWSFLDLTDAGIRGGRLHDITLGLNWYLNKHTKFQLNYVHAFLNTPGLGDSDAGIIAARAQLDF